MHTDISRPPRCSTRAGPHTRHRLRFLLKRQVILHVSLSGSSNRIIYSEIRVWTLGGDVVYTLSGHTSFVYSLSVLPNGDIVSGGEDRSVRVWRGASVTLPSLASATVCSSVCA